MPISAKDKVVVITGGAGEMGSSIARRLVEEGRKSSSPTSPMDPHLRRS
jgi:prephenate dehydrogenase